MVLNRGGVMRTAVDGLRAFGAGVLALVFARFTILRLRFTHPTYGRPVCYWPLFFCRAAGAVIWRRQNPRETVRPGRRPDFFHEVFLTTRGLGPASTSSNKQKL
ncbi:hypothetical protein D3C85_1358470 [compost metagenome]